MLIGDARVSTTDQNLDLQYEASTASGCEQIIDDTMTGRTSQRPGLNQTLDILREGDTLIVWKLDRLGRPVKNLVTRTLPKDVADDLVVSVPTLFCWVPASPLTTQNPIDTTDNASASGTVNHA